MSRHPGKNNIIFLFIAIGAYSVITLTRYQIARFTADSMLYISIAEKYIAGNFKDAINGYWGPLLAWLIVPVLHFKVSDIMAVNIIDLMSGIIIILCIWQLSGRLRFNGWLKAVIVLISVPVIVWFSLVQPMDILLTAVVLLYLIVVLRDDYSERIGNGLLCGFLGSLAYFSKSYGFPFFIAHFLFMNLFYYISRKDKRIIKNAIAGLLVFFLISGIWIGLISAKYGYLTFSTMSKTNFNFPPPEALNRGREFNVPVFYEGFFAPPNDTAFVVWEDPSYLEGNRWKPWHSLTYFKHFLKLLFKNTVDTIKIFNDYSFLSMGIIILALLLILDKPSPIHKEHLVMFYLLFTSILYTGGYIIFHVEERYLWIVNIMLILMGGYIIALSIRENFIKTKVSKLTLILLFAISFTIIPFKSTIQAGGTGNMDLAMYELALDLKKYNIKGNIASNRLGAINHDAWHRTFRLAYWLGCKYYGQNAEGITDDELESDLKKYNIDYYFVWGDSLYIPEFLLKYKEITGGEIEGLKIFLLKGNGADGI